MSQGEDSSGSQQTTSAAVSYAPRNIPNYEPIVIAPAPIDAAAFDKTGPRLMISKIVNENFKSYQGVQSLGPFHKSFTSIVGPNGSGKSNVIDSMLFVFGFRASKIRSKKLCVLIHKSEGHQNITSCTVSVHFQKIIDTGPGENEYEIVEGSEFIVSRTAFQDNSSYYRVNDKKQTVKEVTALLRKHGIDLDHNRFLILQGEVEQIAMMKPRAQTEHDEGMLEYLEDIIGSGRFKEPIEILSQRVVEMNDLRSEKLNRVKIVEKEKDELEVFKDEALSFLKMENDIVKKKNLLYQKYIYDCVQVYDKAVVRHDEIKDTMKEATSKIDELGSKKKEKMVDYNKICSNFDKLMKNCESSKEQFSQCEQEDVKLRENLKFAKAKTKKIDKNLEQEKNKLTDLKMMPKKMEEDIAEIKKKLEKHENDKAKEDEKLKDVMKSLKTETQGLQEEKDEKEKVLLEREKNVNEAQSKLNVTKSELEIYMSNQRRERTKFDETERNLKTASYNLDERKKSLKEITTKLPDVQNQLIKLEMELKKVTEAKENIAAEVKSGRVKVQEMRDNMNSASNRGQLLDALMDQKERGTLKGIHGRLGDLGAIDEKYDIAVSTACGALDNIVTDTIDEAQKCVEYLKRNNLGVCTFIALDKIQKWRTYCEKKITTPENVPRLFDLIKVKDNKIEVAFYFALRDTLVAKNLDQASRIAYGKTRYRVVTLDGALIDQSGTMSGGGGRVSKGRMGRSVITASVNPKELKLEENILEKNISKAGEIHNNYLMLEENLEKMQKTQKELKYGVNKFEMEIKSGKEQKLNLEKQLKEQENRLKAAAPEPAQLKELEKKIEILEKEFKKADESASVVKSEVHSLHKQIMDIGGTKLKAVESKLALIQNHIDQCVGNITKSNVTIKTSNRNIKKSEEKIASLEEESITNTNAIEEYKESLKNLETKALDVMQKYNEAQEEMKTAEKTLSEMKEDLAKIDENEQEFQKDLIDVRHQLEKSETFVKDYQNKLKHWKKEHSKLTLHEIHGEEKDSLETCTEDSLEKIDKESSSYEITVLEEKLAQMKPNMAAIAEYRKKEELYLKRVAELDEITTMRDDQRRQHDDLSKQRLNEFMTGFGIITNKLKEMYQMITLGGDAELELVDSLDPFSEGIAFSVRPPKKSWKNISNLSGGEKTLSSLALVFALHYYRPTPLYVMDEIDAALDFKNVSIVANYIKERTKNAQFIIISLRNNMFELADRLVGIYKTSNCTKTVTVNPQKITIPSKENLHVLQASS